MHQEIDALIHNAHRSQPVDYHSRMDRLRQDVKIMSPFMGVPRYLRSSLVPRNEQHFAVRKRLADFNGRINPRHSVHHYIAYEHIEGGSSCLVDCLRAAVSGKHSKNTIERGDQDH